ncbi:MAG TPA: chromosome segregation protein SMC, partial [Candidatus Aminicenantes bacterium]|nr:chromosome segregation protein SMC [Candidatus Aminicenantes bacterium]
MTNRLKSLELQGYKTFAAKTVFEFPATVTAIVGPNGAGKSNIADAIRWVLGEQAYSLLRGKKTVDMIFFGSEERSRASMASVSITLDNEDGWLPIDFSEVVITRRAYRSGENEYLINNQRVRLKEINELLANSGLGERTYTIIGQGLVDSSLSLRPDERRAFFEEAAGIGLYRGRREESVQKLNTTVRNMERVTDILGELKPRLETLQKSMEKAANYEHIRADLEMLLRDWYGYQWNQRLKDLREAEDVYREQKEILDEKRAEKEAVERDVDELQKSLGANRTKLAEYHRELAANHTRIEEINREIAVLDERSKSAQNRLDELTSSVTLLQNELEKHKSRHEALVKE